MRLYCFSSSMWKYLKQIIDWLIHFWWLITCDNVAGIRDAPVAGKTLFLAVSVWVFPEEIKIWISRLSKELPSPMWASLIQSIEGPIRSKRRRKGELSLLELEHPSSSVLGHQSSCFSSLWTWAQTPAALLGLQLQRAVHGTSRPPSSQAHSYDEFHFIYPEISYWFYFTGEPWLIHHLNFRSCSKIPFLYMSSLLGWAVEC